MIIGCIIAELLLGEPLFAGETGNSQIAEIIKILGTPSETQMISMGAKSTNIKLPIIQSKSWLKVNSC